MALKMSGEHHLPEGKEKIWEMLNDPEVLRACIPGCEELTKKSDAQLTAIVKTRIGPVSARFKGIVNIEDSDPPNGYRLVGQGDGGASGFAEGAATVTLMELEAGRTLLRYDADAKVGGKLAQVGARLVDGVAKKLTEQFFQNFSEFLTKGPAQVVAPVKAGEPTWLQAAIARIKAMLTSIFSKG